MLVNIYKDSNYTNYTDGVNKWLSLMGNLAWKWVDTAVQVCPGKQRRILGLGHPALEINRREESDLEHEVKQGEIGWG